MQHKDAFRRVDIEARFIFLLVGQTFGFNWSIGVVMKGDIRDLAQLYNFPKMFFFLIFKEGQLVAFKSDPALVPGTNELFSLLLK